MQQSGWRWPLGAAVVLALFLLTNGAGAQEAAYGRIIVDSKTTVFVEFKGEEMRLATSIDGLKSARAIRVRQEHRTTSWFPRTALPLPARSKLRIEIEPVLIKGAAGGKGGSTSSGWRVLPTYQMATKDASGANWTYAVKTTGATNLGKTQGEAPVIDTIPQPLKASLKITVKLEPEKARIGLMLMLGKLQIAGIKKNDQNIQATLKLTDSANNEIANEKGDVSKFGFT